MFTPAALSSRVSDLTGGPGLSQSYEQAACRLRQWHRGADRPQRLAFMCVPLRLSRSAPPPQFVKCGFAGDNFPAHIFPSIVGRPILRAEEKVGQVQLKVHGPRECGRWRRLSTPVLPSGSPHRERDGGWTERRRAHRVARRGRGGRDVSARALPHHTACLPPVPAAGHHGWRRVHCGTGYARAA